MIQFTLIFRSFLATFDPSFTISEIIHTRKKLENSIGIQCKDVNRMVLKHKPGIYIIERKTEGDTNWSFPSISNGTTFDVSNLKPGSRNRFRIYEVNAAGISDPEVTPWYKTHEDGYEPMAVKNITISTFEVNEKKDQLRTQLTVIPADDRNCIYNIIHWGGQHNLYQYQLDAAHGYEMKIGHLEFNKSNILYAISRNEINLKQSKNVTLKFTTPTCLSMFNDLSICAPLPASGIEVIDCQVNSNLMSLKVAWNKPELQPDSYTVMIQPFSGLNNSIEVNFPGNETEAYITNIPLHQQYKIGVISESKGGSSFQWIAFTRSEHITDGSRVVILLSTLTTITIFLTIAFVYYRVRILKDHACQYSFFEIKNFQNIAEKGCAFEDVMSPLKSPLPFDFDEGITMDKFEIPFESLTIKRILGSGFSGVVKLATLCDNKKRSIDVAVKMLKDDASTEDVKNFHREILLMKSAGNHRNIVSLIGCCTLDKMPLLIVEYCAKGDLQTYLKTIYEQSMTAILTQVECPSISNLASQDYENSKVLNSTSIANNRLYDIQQAIIQNNISVQDLLNFARQVATGMEFLSSNRIVHRDLAARNVLVCADRTVKISDFGLSRDVYQENVYRKHSSEKMPLKWMAIEALTHQIYTSYSDVWSFGVLVYEIVTLGGNPYPGLQGNQILQLLKRGYRMKRPSNCGFELYEIMRACWHDNPLSRPTFTQLKDQLDKLLSTSTENEYLNLSELVKEPDLHQPEPIFPRYDGNNTKKILLA
ncbi:hypothetical protein QAD02_001538 [Eretmocerus hayati]|uniref:Uncharacterized protein n=1 Tax=Eretmocerus hayati TaxID=131215 RepID=A0ACC2NIX1_9HYME|nr:hypothetical protein QAD02_001538 [Eretmocerus hayati]